MIPALALLALAAFVLQRQDVAERVPGVDPVPKIPWWACQCYRARYERSLIGRMICTRCWQQKSEDSE